MAACLSVDSSGLLHLDSSSDISQCGYFVLSQGEYSLWVPDPAVLAKYFAWGFGSVVLMGVVGMFIGFAVQLVRTARFV